MIMLHTWHQTSYEYIRFDITVDLPAQVHIDYHFTPLTQISKISCLTFPAIVLISRIVILIKNRPGNTRKAII